MRCFTNSFLIRVLCGIKIKYEKQNKIFLDRKFPFKFLFFRRSENRNSGFRIWEISTSEHILFFFRIQFLIEFNSSISVEFELLFCYQCANVVMMLGEGSWTVTTDPLFVPLGLEDQLLHPLTLTMRGYSYY